MDLMNSQRKSHIHLQFAQASATTKNCKRICLANPRPDRVQFTHPAKSPPEHLSHHRAYGSRTRRFVKSSGIQGIMFHPI